jgi:broad specificity phosphatase PhoE
MKHIYLVRHCQATGQEADAPLTALGQEQANGWTVCGTRFTICLSSTMGANPAKRR